MIDDFDARLGAELQRLTLPAAPDGLRARVRGITLAAPQVRARRSGDARPRWTILIASATALIVVAAGTILLVGGIAPGPAVSSATPSASALPSPSAAPISSASPSIPPAVEGLSVMTVSEAIAKRDAGSLGSDPVAIRGFWSAVRVRHGCAPPNGHTGVLEIYCHEREVGITELDEQIELISKAGAITVGSGPWLTPFVTGEVYGAAALFSLPMINGQQYPPVPIVVVGHFNDPRAADCRPVALEICRNRLVVDQIVQFDPTSVPSPAPTPTPTPFPFADPPPAIYKIDDCAEGHPIKFAGWTTLRSLGIDIASPDDIAYIVITAKPIVIGDWDNGYRLWGQRVCYGYEWDPGAIGFTAIPGTYFREYRDGHHEPTEGP
jgi:hypothetical protein